MSNKTKKKPYISIIKDPIVEIKEYSYNEDGKLIENKEVMNTDNNEVQTIENNEVMNTIENEMNTNSNELQTVENNENHTDFKLLIDSLTSRLDLLESENKELKEKQVKKLTIVEMQEILKKRGKLILDITKLNDINKELTDIKLLDSIENLEPTAYNLVLSSVQGQKLFSISNRIVIENTILSVKNQIELKLNSLQTDLEQLEN